MPHNTGYLAGTLGESRAEEPWSHSARCQPGFFVADATALWLSDSSLSTIKLTKRGSIQAGAFPVSGGFVIP